MPSETTDAAQAFSNLTSASNHLRQKRARSQLSCMPCRSGKLKCNRSHEPACDQCIKRNRESSCLYVPPPVKQKPAQNVKGRIRQLETLVVDLMKQQNAQSNGESDRRGSSATRYQDEDDIEPYTEPTPPSDNDSSSLTNHDSARSEETGDDVDNATKPFGQMRISRDGCSYVGDSHWQAILNGISDLKRDLVDEDDVAEDERVSEEREEAGGGFGNVGLSGLQFVPMGGSQPFATTGLGFMLGSSSTITREQLVAQVPEKKVADRLLSLWFNSPDPFKPIIHAPTFQEEYRQFWKTPKETPTMWLALLFSIMSLSASFGLRDVHPTSPKAQEILAEVNRYHTVAASAAVLADFTKPKKYTIECLILYSAGLRSNDAFVNVWLMIGLCVRLALRMGYHRDPSNYIKISPFDGEMRRRVWALISMIDVLISFQLGLPSMVKVIQSDTEPPRNLLDRDINTSMKVLPPSRGIHELTPCSYTRAKLRITRIFADASESSHATVPPAYEDMMELDRKLEEAKSQIPPLLQMPGISELVTDPAEQLMCRFNLDLLYLKTKTVLHRRYMERPFSQLTPEEQMIGIGRNRKACVDCALKVLQHHHTIYSASQPGGQLESVKWYMGSISTHDFLLAAMVVCLELSHQIKNDPSINPGGILCPQRNALMEALERSQKIWSETSGRKRKLAQFVGRDEIYKGENMFDETEKASRAMAVMLEKVKAQFPTAGGNASLNEKPNPLGYLQPGNENVQFGGIVSLQEWADVPMPATSSVSFDMHGNPFTHISPSTEALTGSDGFAQVSSTEGTPDELLGTDFSMIGDMLDVQGNIDWEMWDHQINKGHTPAWSNGADQDQDATAGIRIGNAMTGGTGPGTLRPDMPGPGQHDRLSSDASSNPSTDPKPTNIYPGSWMTFQDMSDVDYNIDIDQIVNPGRSAPWPAQNGTAVDGWTQVMAE